MKAKRNSPVAHVPCKFSLQHSMSRFQYFLAAALGQAFTSDFFGKLDTLGVCQRFALFTDVLDVQDLAHELNDRLGTIESSR